MSKNHIDKLNYSISSDGAQKLQPDIEIYEKKIN